MIASLGRDRPDPLIDLQSQSQLGKLGLSLGNLVLVTGDGQYLGPASASFLAVALPMPEVAPVISTTLPSTR